MEQELELDSPVPDDPSGAKHNWVAESTQQFFEKSFRVSTQRKSEIHKILLFLKHFTQTTNNTFKINNKKIYIGEQYGINAY